MQELNPGTANQKAYVLPLRHSAILEVKVGKKVVCSLRFCVSSLHRDHANLLCIYIALFNVRDRRPGQFHFDILQYKNNKYYFAYLTINIILNIRYKACTYPYRLGLLYMYVNYINKYSGLDTGHVLYQFIYLHTYININMKHINTYV